MNKLFEIPSALDDVKFAIAKKAAKGNLGFYYFLGDENRKEYHKIISEHALPYQKKGLDSVERETVHFTGKRGLVWIQKRPKVRFKNHFGLFNESPYGAGRDGLGALVPIFKALGISDLQIHFVHASVDEIVGALAGFDIGAYQFKSIFEGKKMLEGLPKVQISSVGEKVDQELVATAKEISVSVNSARHLTNLPPNVLNPKSFADFIEASFKKQKDFKCEIWSTEVLEKEGMGLHLAVGQGAIHGPRLAILRYRPKGLEKMAPIAIVGKGITFDTGGLDIKPSSAMRLMKKDMGGAAATFGSAVWVAHAKPKIAVDFYFALAENAVDANSFRPSDIVKGRNGQTVEIHNTDAEGRLVLADALDVATDSKPKCILDLATLTGAIKVALGADVAGLFSNNDDLADLVFEASRRGAELAWRMPLVPKYASQMNSTFASQVNAVDGFGGAITAAMFLERYVKDIPWAHLDIYAWADKASGAVNVAGGNGQAVQTIAAFLSLMETREDLSFS